MLFEQKRRLLEQFVWEHQVLEHRVFIGITIDEGPVLLAIIWGNIKNHLKPFLINLFALSYADDLLIELINLLWTNCFLVLDFFFPCLASDRSSAYYMTSAYWAALLEPKESQKSGLKNGLSLGNTTNPLNHEHFQEIQIPFIFVREYFPISEYRIQESIHQEIQYSL